MFVCTDKTKKSVVIYIDTIKLLTSEIIVITDVQVNIKSFTVTVSVRSEDILVECPIDTYSYGGKK